MSATQEAHAARVTSCSICQRSVRVNPLKATDVGVICRMCRCKRCSIPISAKPCHRCGVAHGTPSSEPGMCERCFETSTDHAPMSAADESVVSHTLWSVHEAHADSHEFVQ
jgi:hypothetical protein